MSGTPDQAVPCVVGVDGGGTKTACQVATPDGEVLGEAQGGPSNYQTVGAAATRDALREAITGAAQRTGRPLRVVGACLALAGVDRPEDRAAVVRIAADLAEEGIAGLRWDLPPAVGRGQGGAGIPTPPRVARQLHPFPTRSLRSLESGGGPAARSTRAGAPGRAGWPANVVIANDAVAALVGGAGRAVGVVAVAGTGSIAFGQDRRRRQRRAGGWGHLLGDEGSGYAIGLAGLRAVCRAADGRGRATSLTPLVMGRCGLDDPSGLIGLAYGAGSGGGGTGQGDAPPRPGAGNEEAWGVPQVAACAPLVGQAAGAGDAVAQEILDGAAGELVLAAATVIRALDLAGEAFEVVTAGGLWEGLPRLRERFTEGVLAVAPAARVIAPRAPPVAGAVLLARESIGAVRLD